MVQKFSLLILICFSLNSFGQTDEFVEAIDFATQASLSLKIPVAIVSQESDFGDAREFVPLENFQVKVPKRGFRFFGVDFYKTSRNFAWTSGTKMVGGHFRNFDFEAGQGNVPGVNGLIVNQRKWIGTFSFTTRVW